MPLFTKCSSAACVYKNGRTPFQTCFLFCTQSKQETHVSVSSCSLIPFSLAFRWLCVKQLSHYDWRGPHADGRGGHLVFSAGPVALHQTPHQEIHLRTASPRYLRPLHFFFSLLPSVHSSQSIYECVSILFCWRRWIMLKEESLCSVQIRLLMGQVEMTAKFRPPQSSTTICCSGTLMFGADINLDKCPFWFITLSLQVCDQSGRYAPWNNIVTAGEFLQASKKEA